MFPELKESIRLSEALAKHGKTQVLCQIEHRGKSYPVHAVELGSSAPDAPVLGIIGGIHGIERIGTWVCHAFMNHLLNRLEWDESLHFILSKMRIFFIPLVNPVGMQHFTRSNGNGVDLMRNAPIDAEESTFGVGGHRLSRHLPWFRGNEVMTESGMESELKAIYDFIKAQTQMSPTAILLDLHSGFGIVDQLWFPYAKQKDPPPFISDIYALKNLFESTNPNHIYRFEPQSKHYCTHGDLWDYLLLQTAHSGPSEKILLPFTLEMGSWNWVRKNPIQILSFLGAFNPIKPHRVRRTLRRHLPLFDFLLQALSSPKHWTKPTISERYSRHELALQEWYPRKS